MLGGLVWLCMLPLNQYSRQTYISENALLPGQVHTYFGGSEQNVFRAYRHEIEASMKGRELDKGGYIERGVNQTVKSADTTDTIEDLFSSVGLKSARQGYRYQSSGATYAGENVYAILNAPRGDSTEAIVLLAALKNVNGEENLNGVSLLVTLARYFKRWSLWSKDIIFVVTPDSFAGPQAWINAYHSTHNAHEAEDLHLKSGALQAAVCFDYPFEQHFSSLHIAYDGVNGQLPNLDLFNTAISIASGQMGIGTSIQGMNAHGDSYVERLETLFRGMASQALGHATGPHSVFMPYHIDAITLSTHGDGPQDEMALGRTIESICRSLNNLLEHLHQSFFFYLLMQSNRFVSIGTYLPSAMVIAAAYSIMAIHLWVRSGYEEAEDAVAVETKQRIPETTSSGSKAANTKAQSTSITGPSTSSPATTTPPPPKRRPIDRDLALPFALLTLVHASALIPIYLTTTLFKTTIPQILFVFSLATLVLPIIFAAALPDMPSNTSIPAFAAPTENQYVLTKALSLLVLGMALTVLATLNFSLSVALGIACAPLAFTWRDVKRPGLAGLQYALLAVFSPAGAIAAVAAYGYVVDGRAELVVDVVARLAFGWNVWSSWGVLVGVCCVWWPAWVVGAMGVAGSWYGEGGSERKVDEKTAGTAPKLRAMVARAEDEEEKKRK